MIVELNDIQHLMCCSRMGNGVLQTGWGMVCSRPDGEWCAPDRMGNGVLQTGWGMVCCREQLNIKPPT